MCIGIFPFLFFIPIFSSVYSEIKNGNIKIDLIGEIADYGDFYGKNEVNIFTFFHFKANLNYTNVINVYGFDKNEKKFNVVYMYEFEHSGYCEGLSVTDWTMDSKADVLVFLRDDDGIYTVGLMQSGPPDDTNLILVWTSRDPINNTPTPIELTRSSDIHPFLCDIDGDGLPDMVTQASDGTRIVWINSDQKFIPYTWDEVPNVKFIKNSNEAIKNKLPNDYEHWLQEDDKLLRIIAPHSNGFVDLNGDCRPDLLFTVGTPRDGKLEIWLSDVDPSDKPPVMRYIRVRYLLLPPHFGQLIYADLNGDGTIDIGIPHCIPSEELNQCIESGFSIMYNTQQPLCNNLWNDYESDCRRPTDLCSYSKFKIDPYYSILLDNSGDLDFNNFDKINYTNFGPVLRLAYGDIDIDGYPDIAFIATNPSSNKPHIYVYNNMLSHDTPKFKLLKHIPIERYTTFLFSSEFDYRISFFDFLEHGAFYIFLFGLPNGDQFAGTGLISEVKPKHGDSGLVRKIKKMKYDLSSFSIKFLPFASYDSKSEDNRLFLKASSIGPVSYIHFQDDINSENNLHGNILSNEGQVFMITVSDRNSIKTPKQAVQRPLSGYSPLQLPYVIFGLGKTNNYVEEFYLGMSSHHREYKNMWISIIPNCHVVAVTNPLDIPSMWNLKLTISPSKKFMQIMYTTLVCLGVIGLFIIICHAREKREDSEQERGFKQKFIAH